MLVTAGNNLSIDNMAVGGTLTVTAENGTISSDDDSEISVDGDMTLEGATIDLGGTLTAGANVTATSTGDLTQDGIINATGNVDLTAQNNIVMGSVTTSGNLAAYSTDGAVSAGGALSSTGNITLDSSTGVQVEGAINAAGKLTMAALSGHVDISTAVADTVDIIAVQGFVTGERIESTATAIPDTGSNLQILALEVGQGSALELLIESGTATVAVANVNNTLLVDNEASRTLLVQVFDSDSVSTTRVVPEDFVRTVLANSKTEGNVDAGIAAADTGYSVEVVVEQNDDLGTEESDYITAETSVKVPEDQEEEDEFGDEFVYLPTESEVNADVILSPQSPNEE